MRRLLFDFAAAVSLVLCLAMTTLWVRSYFVADVIRFRYSEPRDDWSYCRFGWLISGRGGVGLDYVCQSHSPDFRRELQRAMGTQALANLLSHGSGPSPTYPDPSLYHGREQQHLGFKWAGSLEAEDFWWGFDRAKLADREFIAVAPLWCFFVVFLALPVLWGWRRFKKNSHQRELCGHCGYNLTGNVSGVCPECGTPVPVKSETLA